jgi:hypothetical protein
MKKLSLNEATDLGGNPIRLNDLRYVQNGLIECFEAIVKAIAYDATMILTGCIETNPTGFKALSDGYVCLNGEIFKHDAFAYPDLSGGGSGYKWVIVETYPSEGTKAFLSNPGAPINTFLERKIKLEIYTGAYPGVDLVYNPLARFNEPYYLWTKLAAAHGDWITFPFSISSDWSIVTGQPIKARVTRDGYVECYFKIGKLNSSASLIPFNLPTYYRPNKKHNVIALGEDNIMLTFTINTNGDVQFVGDDSWISIGGTSGAPAVLYQGYFKIPLVI